MEDAPFGIRGVANNINPFITSFQRMKTEAGGTGAALKALIAGAFTGPGGLLLISAAVTSAMTLISMGLFDMGEEAEETMEALDELNRAFERTVELQAQFGAFDDDEFGAQQIQATIREITEEITDQEQALRRIKELNEERIELEKGFQTAISETDFERLQQVENELILLGDSEDVQERIKELNEERIRLSVELVNLGEALADSDTQAARAESTKAKANAALIGLKAALLALSREETKELEKQRQIQQEQQAALDRELADIGPMPGGRRAAPDEPVSGSIADIQNQMRAFQNMRQMIDPSSEAFADLTNRIEESKNQLNELRGTGEQSFDTINAAANLFGNALAQAIIRGEELEGVLKSLAAQLASRAIITGLGALLTGGASLGGGTFLSAMFGGFAHGTDMGFPGMGMVGERGRELVVAPPFSSVITNENVEKLANMRQESRQGAANLMGMRGGGIDPGMIERAIIEGMRHSSVNLSIDPVDEKLGDFSQLRKRVGNG